MRWSFAFCLFTAVAFSCGAEAAGHDFQISSKISYASAEAGTLNGADCGWEFDLLENIVKEAKGRVRKLSEEGKGKKIQIEVTGVETPALDFKRKVKLAIRADVMERGVLIATRDFSQDSNFPSKKDNCVALSELGKEIGEDIANWVTSEKMPVCEEGCTGIHPNTPVFVGNIAEGDPDTVSEEVKEKCKWNDYMLNRLVSDFNAQKPAPMFQLKRGMGDEKSRRLELTVTALHTIGGGPITGPKWLAMSGKLYDGKMLVGSFSFKRSSNDFLRMNMCSPLEKLSNEMSETITQWLNEPSIDAGI